MELQLKAKARLLSAEQPMDPSPLFMPERLVMLDCEMTGLDPKKDDIIQLTALKLEWNGKAYARPDYFDDDESTLNLFIHTDLAPTSDFARKHLTEIYRKANESKIDYKMARSLLEQWLGTWKGKVSPCGDCVPTDVLFLYMKNVIDLSHYDGDTPVDGTFHFEFFEMNSLKAVARQKAGRKVDRDVPRLPGDHDALVDCKNQLAEMNAIIAELMR